MSDPPLLVFDSARLSVDPGGEAVLGLRVRNQATVVDELQVQVLGPAAEWAVAEPSSLSLFPGTDGRAVIRFRPPRSSKLAAGAIPVGIRATSRIDASRTVVDECQLEVGSFRDVTAELRPKSSRGLRRGRHELRLHNAGNVPAGVSLDAEELDGSCRVAVQPRRVVVGPGQVSGARVTVRPSHLLWFSSVETHSFAVRAVPEPGKELKVEGSMRQGPLVPGTAATLALVAVVAVAVATLLLGRGTVPIGAITLATPTPDVASAGLTTSPSAPLVSPSASLSPSPSKSAPTPSASGSPVAPAAAPVASPTPPLTWPSPADCITYNPNTLTQFFISYVNLWLVESGSMVLEFEFQADASDGLALAKRYTQRCYIGRGNTRTDHYSYVMDYWLGPSGLTTTIATRDCVPYNRDTLSVVSAGATGWEVTDSSSVLQLFDTQADASAGVMVLRHTTSTCYVGRDEPLTEPNRTLHITKYFS